MTNSNQLSISYKQEKHQNHDYNKGIIFIICPYLYPLIKISLVLNQ